MLLRENSKRSLKVKESAESQKKEKKPSPKKGEKASTWKLQAAVGVSTAKGGETAG